MLDNEIIRIIEASEANGWVLEPDAKRLMAAIGVAVPVNKWAKTLDEACESAETIGYPVVAKVVSPRVIHKSDVGGVVVGITDEGQLLNIYQRFSKLEDFSGILVEEMIAGVELFVGAKIDYQFGPVILLGIGGTGVEIYNDTAIRMAPLTEGDVASMVAALKARRVFEGYRGSEPVNMAELARTIVTFSSLVVSLEAQIESIDLNPVMCTAKRCVVADARIMLNR